jgi:hypothetical protein
MKPAIFVLLNDQVSGLAAERKLLIEKERAEFALRKRIINCLLGLLIIRIFSALVVVALIVDGRIAASITVAAILCGTTGCIGKLLNTAFKSIFRVEE